MKLRTRTLWINIVTVLLAVGVLLYLIYPHIYISEGMDGVKFLLVSLLLVGAGTSLARMSLLEFFVVGKADMSVSETNRLKASVGSLSLGFVLIDAHN